jgi:hypothetical protein
MHKEVQAQQSDQVGETPAQPAAHLQILQEEDGNQCCPNLDMHGVGARAHEGLDLQVLLERLEEEFNLPALLVDRGDGRCRQLEVIRAYPKTIWS